MPAAINVLEVGVLAALAEPERLVQADFDGVEPGVKEVDEGDDGEVCGGEDDPGAVADVAEGDGRDEDDAGGC
jgi:hypothetical protein